MSTGVVPYWTHSDAKSNARLQNLGVPEVNGRPRTLLKRRGWDSNPRTDARQTISSRSLSTTQPPLH